MGSLITDYRPSRLADVIGQRTAVTAIEGILRKKSAQSFLLDGPSGCGKTTLARIIADEVGCTRASIMEIDAATFTGIDAMRQITSTLNYATLSGATARAVIVDEAHRLSRQAWDSLLKSVEEPPKHVYWFFCTTELGKVPKTIVTRCARITLKLVSDKDLTPLIESVAKQEGITLARGVLDLVVREAHGSPRQALVNLASCANAKDRQDAASLLRSATDSDATIELCRFLVNGAGSWNKAMAIVERLDDESPESVRIVLCNYAAAALKKSASEKSTLHLLDILEQFSTPFNPSEGVAPLLLAIGRTLYAR